MQGCRTEGYEGCECKDARLKDTKDGGCCLVTIPRSLVAPTRGAGGYTSIYIYITPKGYLPYTSFPTSWLGHMSDVHVHPNSEIVV